MNALYLYLLKNTRVVKYTLLILLALTFLGCSSEDPTISPDPEYKKENPLEGLADKGAIRFDKPEIGQRSFYVFFNASESNTTHEISFDYFADTLVLAITGQEADKWIVKEFLTEGSNSVTSDDGHWGSVADSVIIRHLEVDADSAYFFRPQGTDPFSFVFVGASIAFPLLPVGDPAPLNANCLPILDYESTSFMQYAVNYSQFGQTFEHLNIYFDYTPMNGDGSGFMHAYGSSFGIVRWTWVSYWSLGHADGWDLIPN